MMPSQATPAPQLGGRLVAAVEAKAVAIERAMLKAFWNRPSA